MELSVRVRRWPSEGRVGCDEGSRACLATGALTSLLALTAASFCSGTFMRFAADADEVRPCSDAVAVVASDAWLG
jgi:hypothetical protein